MMNAVAHLLSRHTYISVRMMEPTTKIGSYLPSCPSCVTTPEMIGVLELAEVSSASTACSYAEGMHRLPM